MFSTMTNDIAIKVENLSKRYRIGLEEEVHDTLASVVTDFVRSPFKNLRRLRQLTQFSENGGDPKDIIWALKDVSFEVESGEVVGIIGANGAGKSTLLKILSRITHPTSGWVKLNGRVSSLLEVGTGFHGELSGRDNIYLNGTILGMSKAEVDRKFDVIVDFSGVEKFIDTPVKRYSSGMRIRLAFSVAAHLEPEILLIDEVLAVGDADFQKKCLGKMGDVAKEGRTVLFVSHNMIAVQNLCNRVIWLDEGSIIKDSETSLVVSKYLQTSISGLNEQVWGDRTIAPGNDTVRLRKVCIRPENGSPSDQISMQTPLVIEVEYWNMLPEKHLHVTLHFITEKEVVAFTSGSTNSTYAEGLNIIEEPPIGLFRSICYIPGNLLNSGSYRIKVMLVRSGRGAGYTHDDAVSFEVVEQKDRNFAWHGKEPGAVRPVLAWDTELLEGKIAK